MKDTVNPLVVILLPGPPEPPEFSPKIPGYEVLVIYGTNKVEIKVFWPPCPEKTLIDTTTVKDFAVKVESPRQRYRAEKNNCSDQPGLEK